MIEEVLPNLYRIEVPLPQSPLGWVNSYVIKDPERNLIIDTGLNRKECLEAMLAGLAEAGVELKDTDFFITHHHADHLALAQELCNGTAKVYMNKADKEYTENWQSWEPIARFLALNGFPLDEIDLAISNHPAQKYGSDRMPAMSAVKDGDIIRRGGFNLMAVATPGHTSGHTCLYDAANRLLFSGDHILIDITPNISCSAEGANPLELYLASLDKVHGLQVDLVLPGHRRIIKDCKGRIEELRKHHHQRLQEVLSILEHAPRPQNAYEVASMMTWDIDCSSWAEFPVSQRWFATGEAIAHLTHLENQGQIIRSERLGCRVYSIP